MVSLHAVANTDVAQQGRYFVRVLQVAFQFYAASHSQQDSLASNAESHHVEISEVGIGLCFQASFAQGGRCRQAVEAHLSVVQMMQANVGIHLTGGRQRIHSLSVQSYVGRNQPQILLGHESVQVQVPHGDVGSIAVRHRRIGSLQACRTACVACRQVGSIALSVDTDAALQSKSSWNTIARWQAHEALQGAGVVDIRFQVELCQQMVDVVQVSYLSAGLYVAYRGHGNAELSHVHLLHRATHTASNP